MNTLALLMFASCLIIDVNAFGQNYWKIKEHLQRQSYDKQQQERNQRMKIHGQPSQWLQAIDKTYYITQPMDHFDAENQDTYEQRYWVNDQFFTSSKGPVFLYIGGEGPLNALAAQEGEQVVLAKKYGALLFAVEHRFYGASVNDNGLELKNLRFLSSQQALADLASFHAFVSDKYNLTEDNRWISFGGSYPGALSAWFRLKYPHLVHAAVASSAPVNTVVNFEGYNEVVTSSLSDPIVNGSLKCVLHIKEAFKTLDMKLQKLDYESVARDFKSCKPLANKLDVFQLVSNLADIFMSSVQYDGDGPSYSIGNVCAMMTKAGDPYDNLINVNEVFLKNSMTKCSDNSWNDYVELLKNTSMDKTDPFARSDRQWLYQTCSQFGYYQTCGVNTTCPFSRYMELWPNLEICRSVYNIDPDLVYKRVDFTNAYYGAGHIKGTRIVFVNGSIDPWHALGILKSLSASEIAVFINGTSHCADLEPERQRDTLALRSARQQIDKQLGMWLAEDS